MKLVMGCMSETRRDLSVVQKDVMKLDSQQEGIEHQVSTLNERVMEIEKYMDTIATHLNNAIERINTIHVYLKNQQKEEKETLESLICHEVLSSSDDEFSFGEPNKFGFDEPNDGKMKEQ